MRTFLAALVWLLAGSPVYADVLVGSFNTDQILRFDNSGEILGVFSNDPILDGPVEMILGSDNRIYASAFNRDRVIQFDTDGTVLRVIGSGSGLDGPRGIAIGNDGNIYVSSTVNDTIKRFDGSNGAYLDDFAVGNIDAPQGLAFTSDNRLLVVSRSTNSVEAFDAQNGSHLGQFASAGISDIKIGSDGSVYVAETDAIGRYAMDGSLIRRISLTGVLDLTINHDGDVFASSFGPDLVNQYTSTLDFVDPFIASGGGGLSGATGVTFFVPVPEPNSIGLLLSASCFLLIKRRR